MNQVFKLGKRTPLTLPELQKEFGIPGAFTMDRIEGDLCECDGEGKFDLLEETDPAVVEGGKRYMVCRKCGCWSHL